MINFPYVSLPENFTKLLTVNIQNTTLNNNQLEMYINENKNLNALVKKLFLDIDPDGFLGKIINIAGFPGIRNRLAAAFIEYKITGVFPETANIALVNELISIENKLRHFTNTGFHRSFLLAFYAKMSVVHVRTLSDSSNFTPLMIKDEHLDLMKLSRSKSTRIDWLILQLIQFEHFLGIDRVHAMLSSELKHSELFSMCTEEEQRQILKNNMTYAASINDFEMFTMDLTSTL